MHEELGYIETNMSKRARKMFHEIVAPDSLEGRATPRYYPKDRESFCSLGSLDYDKIAQTLSPSNEMVDLSRRCIELNMDSEELHKVIKARIKQKYKEWRNIAYVGKYIYERRCRCFGIQPDENFSIT